MQNEIDFLREEQYLQRLQQQEYVLWQRLERMYIELANIQASIGMSINNMDICQLNQNIVQKNLLRYKEFRASETLTPTL